MTSSGTKNILVAEDTRINQKVFQRIISKAGYNACIKENGQEALDIYLSDSFDLIVTDIMMPIMDGIEFIKQVRALKGNKKDIYIIAASADASPSNKEQCLEAGANVFVAKPINSREFGKLIHQALDSSTDQESPVEDLLDIYIPILDMSIIEDISEGDFEIELEIVEAIIEGLEEELTSFDMGVKSNDFEAIGMNVHRIKGNLGQVGEKILCKQALHIEDLCNQEDIEAIRVLSSEFLKSLVAVRSELKNWITR
ncbi:response regulator [bacterium]|nr:response regulator [bacterium]